MGKPSVMIVVGLCSNILWFTRCHSASRRMPSGKFYRKAKGNLRSIQKSWQIAAIKVREAKTDVNMEYSTRCVVPKPN